MPSQKRKNHNNQKKQQNPLAHARGPQKAAEQVWFKRSGAGSLLFVEYYTRQPDGVIAAKEEEYQEKGVNGEIRNVNVPSLTGTKSDATLTLKGMSRATKRRRKKIGAIPMDHSIMRIPEADTGRTAIQPEPLLPSSGLLQAVASFDALVQPHQRPFFCAMSRPLPTTFRIRQYHSSSDAENYEHERRTQSFLQGLSNFQPDIVRPVPFSFHNELFQATLPKWRLPQSLKDLLLEYSQNGVLARQELGSMLPVLALPLQQGDCVVDMCASPGSKTMQAIEQCCCAASPERRHMHRKGLVLANDVHQTRLDALRAAVDRSGLGLLSDHIRYSQVDATKLKLSTPCDAVICDVPCSGDGTCRKDAHILPMWKPSSGNTLHTTQLAILKRSLDVVKVGGYVCYSTCSLNPVEDEAVVAAALVAFGDTIELVDITNLKNRPNWIHRPGIHSWKVADYVEGESIAGRAGQDDDDDDSDEMPKLTWYQAFEDAEKVGLEGAVASMWSGDHTKSLPLERCARLLPQDFDSGGFFLALLRKLK